MKRTPWYHAALLLLSLTLIAGPPALTQTPQDSARLAGTVRSSINGLPIADVMIAVRGTQLFDVSDSAGAFALTGLPSGHQIVRILYRDSVSYEQRIDLKRGKTLTLAVLLDMDAVELAPIVVEARSSRAERSLAGFYDRKQRGFGRFYTFRDLERRRSWTLRSLLGEAGVQIRCGRGYCLPISWSGTRYCVMSLFLNGMRLSPDDMDVIQVDDLAGVELYKRGFDVPMEFRYGFGDNCGAVLMWRRS
ncbi:MAG: hypothetical protein AUH78_27270 [Gemmatimonadetes bacterium 13_1_40CM_4_69_8]|nr:MAG: hypothetical protein AUH45_04000 [Gemmatimonadetes bacterium 13_1_40CM_69_22]OLC67923.1 MAG: hypothetical protein AUH78_27270 [Gemmatimonadetes bacterium 13_1_40CM_4_69_8]